MYYPRYIALIPLSLMLLWSTWVQGQSEATLGDVLSHFPLAPADTRSPYATLTSFEQLTQATRQQLQTLENLPPNATPTLSAKAQYIDTLIERAQSCFELSDYPQTTRKRIGLESVLLLGEILRRTPAPELSTIPGHPQANARSLPESWVFPGTELTIRQSSDGHYRFSARTVQQLRYYYEQIQHLPTHDPEQRDWYQYFESSPGALIPPRWFRALHGMPKALFTLYADQALWQWIALITLGVLYGLSLLALYRYTPLMRRRVVGSSVLALSLQLVRWTLEHHINIGGSLMRALVMVSELLIWPLIAMATYQALASGLMSLARQQVPDSLKLSMVKVLSTIVSSLAALVVLSYGATRIGIPVYGIVTSLSLGGMAIALAIRPTMENLIGGVVLYLDKAIQVGDYGEFEGIAGTVEAIGIRSTKIRALDRTLITIANGHLVRMKLTNYSRRDKFQLRTTLSVTYATTMTQLSEVINALSAYLEHREDIAAEPMRVHFTRFSGSSLDIDIHAYVYANDRSQFLALQQSILMDISVLLARHEVNFAYPSQTLYLHPSTR
ncbi:mechanosensitive ion channel family protein [Vibrio europaeus]|uniref:mechanosensitive ion channel family protein n=1 Tax=Vibrio europaeus TaxID=300876 RepID=UPI00233E7A02|nr:mechanosensitive ion channel family protein [Vibrio europaeus]MDC5721732.1 mechanosensitive ion channel family protein [Vibrio europaeus]MDC5757092.1 mechanosensitive ion channel family protein [Vibrio europaeus]MDC5776399.1 mechanosensitive ion channel family protein [Vibrio europaeus]MDC5795742.1 mechanosensitive ion channel family protein [Vibrio europaeus]MDC5801685.1 mechanosensitive ion channel family protein [Vibrio europaeus]